jgi:hypothetical protein
VAKFGTISSVVNYPFDERWYLVSPARAVAASGTALIAIGTYTMPFAGTLILDMFVHCSWPAGYQWAGVDLSNSSPVPGLYSKNFGWDGLPNPWGTTIDIPLSGRWTGLTASQVVTLNLLASVGGDPPTVTFTYVGGTVRAFQ